jgi:glucitol operon activator protein
MEVSTIFLFLAAAWLLQMGLAWWQAQAFMKHVKVLRREGKVSIGSSGGRMRGRAYVAMAVDPADRVTAAESLRGTTVFARPKPIPSLVGRVVAEIAEGGELPGLHVRIREATLSAAQILHPPADGTPPYGTTPPVPFWRRLRLRGTAKV